MLPATSVTMELDAATQEYRNSFLVSFWLEALFYGVYLFLFLTALRVALKRSNLSLFAPRFQLAGVLVMFIMISLHHFVNCYRVAYAYGYTPLSDPRPGAPVLYLRDWQTWDYMLFGVTVGIVTWAGDLLIIYRCYLVWQRDLRVIILPGLLLLTCMGITTVNLWWYRHPAAFPPERVKYALALLWPFNLAQNVITTGLIVYRIFAQHLKTAQAKLMVTYRSGTVSLLGVSKIILESAAIYTVVMFMLCIFWWTGNPAFLTLLNLFVPTTGIVFALMSVRTHIAQAQAESMNTVTTVRSRWTRTGAAPAISTQEVQGQNTHPPDHHTRSKSFGLPKWLEGGPEEHDDLQYKIELEDRRNVDQ